MINDESLQQNNGHRRKHARLSTQLPATIISFHGTEAAIMLDLSLSGTKLRLAGDCLSAPNLKIGSNIEIEWGNKATMGSIAWLQRLGGNYDLGVEFFDPILARTLVYTREFHDRFWQSGGFRTMQAADAKEWSKGGGGFW